MGWTLVIIACLIGLSVQDLRERAFYAWFIPLLVIFSLLFSYSHATLDPLRIAYNCLYIVLSLTALQLYYSLSRRKLEPITRSAFAWGDVLILFVPAILLDMPSLIILLILSAFVGLLYFFFSGRKSTDQGIPFAGILALCLIPFILYEQWLK